MEEKPCVIRIPGLSPSGNAIKRWLWDSRTKWRVPQHRREVMDFITNYLLGKYPNLQINRDRFTTVIFDRQTSSRYLDPDNLVAGLKYTTDVLKDLSLIVDDSPGWARFVYQQSKVPRKQECLLIKIYRHQPGPVDPEKLFRSEDEEFGDSTFTLGNGAI